MSVGEQIAEGDKVLTRFTVRATHKGELSGIPASGREVTISFLSLMRVTGVQITDEWERFDTAHLLQQIGAVAVADAG